MRRLVWLLAVLSLVAAGCGGTGDTGFSPTPPPEGNGAENGEDTSTPEDPADYAEIAPIDVADNLFVPRFVRVTAGTAVEWEQTGIAPHNVVADDGSFDSHPECLSDQRCMGQGDDYELVFDEPGEYPYYCVIHGRAGDPENPANMAGVIIVE